MRSIAEMKSIFTVVALAALAYWLQKQIAISRTEDKSTVQRLKDVIKKEAA